MFSSTFCIDALWTGAVVWYFSFLKRDACACGYVCCTSVFMLSFLVPCFIFFRFNNLNLNNFYLHFTWSKFISHSIYFLIYYLTLFKRGWSTHFHVLQF